MSDPQSALQEPAVPALAPAATRAQRRAQKRARLRDGLRLLPFLGIALFILPDLVLSGGPAAEGATQPWLTYLFAAWALLIAVSFALAQVHRRAGADPAERANDAPGA